MENSLANVLTWVGIIFCISQSAMFSGMNLALFSISRLRLEVEASTGNKNAEKLLRLREDSNFILTTVLWGNVGINVLLTLLSSSVLTGVSAFLFSTMVITFAGEILPQAYFSRHALKMVSILAPVLKLYQYLLYPFLLIKDASTPLGNILHRLKVEGTSSHDNVIDQDIVLLWGQRKRILTGADILGRLMQGISKKEGF